MSKLIGEVTVDKKREKRTVNAEGEQREVTVKLMSRG
jgi:hypothetical protein